jgi:hypothetical protein
MLMHKKIARVSILTDSRNYPCLPGRANKVGKNSVWGGWVWGAVGGGGREGFFN